LVFRTNGKENVVLLGMVNKQPVAVKRIPMAQYSLIRESLQKLLGGKYHVAYLVRYLVSII